MVEDIPIDANDRRLTALKVLAKEGWSLDCYSCSFVIFSHSVLAGGFCRRTLYIMLAPVGARDKLAKGSSLRKSQG